MDISVYIFAFFIFILTALIVLLIKKVQSTDARESEAIKEKEKKLFKLYQNLEEMILDAEELIEEAKSNIEDDKKKINSMLERADGIYASTQKMVVTPIEEPVQEVKKSNVVNINTKTAKTKFRGASSRNQQVIGLKKEGRSIEEISKELEISQGEVGLIIGLNR